MIFRLGIILGLVFNTLLLKFFLYSLFWFFFFNMKCSLGF